MSNINWRTEPTYVEKWGDELWLGVKGDKNPGEGSEIDPETAYVQAVGASFMG